MNYKLRDHHNEYSDGLSEELLKPENAGSGVIPKPIRDISDATILERIQPRILSTKSAHEKLKKRVISFFEDTTFKASIPESAENLQILDRWIRKQNSRDIEKYLKSPLLLKKLLRRDCFGERMD